MFAWMKRVLRLPDDSDAIEEAAYRINALSGQPHDRAAVCRGTIARLARRGARRCYGGLGTNTSPIEILQSALESVALRFREVYEVMKRSLGVPREMIASGGALLHSRVWTQMLADALGHPVIPCIEPEATSRGAALLALERIGAIRSIGDPLQPRLSDPVAFVAQNAEIYEAAANRQREFYKKLFEENS